MTIDNQARYVLMTAARNEAANIGRTIESVSAQTVKPVKWVIVSDGSTDGTDEIIKQYAIKHDFIDFQRKECGNNKPDFASKAFALKAGYLRLQGLGYQYIGVLDADITFFAPSYYEEVLKRFAGNPLLGIGGGFIHENDKGPFRSRPANRVHSVAGAIQLFRRECYEMIDGLRPSKAGGEDWMAEIYARMSGWEVQAFPELVAYHHKSGFATRGMVGDCIRQGVMDYTIGSHPLFEVLKCVRRVKMRPFFVGAAFRMYGYTLSWLRGREHAMSPAAMAFLRREQLGRVKHNLNSMVRKSLI